MLEKFLGLNEPPKVYPKCEFQIGQKVFIHKENVPLWMAVSALFPDSLPWIVKAVPLREGSYDGILVVDPEGMPGIVKASECMDFDTAMRMSPYWRREAALISAGMSIPTSTSTVTTAEQIRLKRKRMWVPAPSTGDAFIDLVKTMNDQIIRGDNIEEQTEAEDDGLSTLGRALKRRYQGTEMTSK